jgi:ornithine cyclodeaminase
MRDCIEAMKDLYASEADSVSRQPRRNVTIIDPDSVILTMPAFSQKLGFFAVKIVTEFKRNPERYSMPIQGGRTLLMDSRNSAILAMLDSPAVTALRTGAVSGLATSLLSREKSRKIGLIGSGQQARAMLEAACVVRKIESAKIFSRTPKNAQRFASDMGKKLGLPIETVTERKMVLQDADILNVATNSSTPVLSWEEIPPGIHINSVGTLPDRQELDLETVVSSDLFVDTKEGVLAEAGDVLNAVKSGRLTPNDIKGDLFQLVSNSPRLPGNQDRVTLFKSVGFALQDVYACAYIYRNLYGGKSQMTVRQPSS